MSDTSVLEHVETNTETRPSNGDGDHERFSHVVPKAQLEEAIFNGTPVTAWCGKTWVPTKDPKKYPVCPECKDAWEQMQPGDPDNPDYGKDL
jgi:hypothetical protein